MLDDAPEIPKRLRPVLLELVEGKTNAEIAETCALTVHTVESYVSELLSIFQCKNRTEFVARLFRGEFGDIEEVSG